jgi:hypothetical protein
MLSIGLWRWYEYINITITILDIMHHPVFYLKLNSTLGLKVVQGGDYEGRHYHLECASNILYFSAGHTVLRPRS